ncbi:beta-lactamase family protein [Lederbergia sp. NSJ-179]|uniref:serine hydrolase domain-containing protein n=1 Tax=Lederbergia sp. NSJ-179 TaxID=2931402 RepID=UPI001FD18111|nr:serine hydrolase domain-containing protein [Lederbergia sp. NSJ-179]MCJ7840886.1 beta-lactamase family protein [Lederbergia sp. NSJ-179]
MKNDGWIATFETYVEKVMKESHLPGVAVGLAKDGQVFYEKGFGYRDVENQLKVTRDTVFAIGSITKSFTCVALMQLQEKGQLSLHDPIKKYLPDFHLKNGKYANQMTIHHFMTHTSGIPDLQTFPMVLYESLTEDDFKYDPTIQGNKEAFQPIRTYEEYLVHISQLDFELLGKPGEQWHYSNDCYGLLGAIIEQVSGQKYEKYVQEHILDPSGMKRTSFFLNDICDENVTKIYVSREQNGKKTVVPSPNWWDTPVQRASGFLKSTVSDMLKFTELFRTGGKVGAEQILTNDSVKQMTEVHIWRNPIIKQGYGYGLSIVSDYHGAKLVEHAGGIKGGGAQMYIIPEKGLTGVVLTNFLSTTPTAIMNGAFNRMENRLAEASHVMYDKSVGAKEVSQYVGHYQSESMNLSLSVELKKNQLQTYVLGSPIVLKPIDKDTFLLEGTMDCVKFNRNVQDQIVEMDYKGLKFKKEKV